MDSKLEEHGRIPSKICHLARRYVEYVAHVKYVEYVEYIEYVRYVQYNKYVEYQRCHPWSIEPFRPRAA